MEVLIEFAFRLQIPNFYCCCYCTNNVLSTMMEIAENRLYKGSSKSYALHFLIDSIRIRDLISCIPRTYVYTIIDNQFGPITNFSLDAEFLPTYLYYKISFSFFFSPRLITHSRKFSSWIFHSTIIILP